MALNTEPDSNGNGEEGSNRSFRTAAIALGGIGLLGVILIAVFMISSSGQRAQLLAQQQSVNATNEAVAQAALTTATPLPTNTPVPTNTPKPPAPTATLPPTVAPTQAPLQPVVVTSAAGTLAATPGSVPATKAPSAPATLSGTAKPGTTVATTPKVVTTKNSVNPSGQLSGITPTSSPTATGQTPQTGAGDFLGFLLAAGLIALLIVARRLRMSQA
jgi:hypothetical protein